KASSYRLIALGIAVTAWGQRRRGGDSDMRKHLGLAVMAAVALFMASTAQATIIWFTPADPTAAPPTTMGGYTMTPFGDDARAIFSMVSDVASPLGGVVGFSPDVE